MKAIVKLSSPIISTARVLQCSGIFDLPMMERSQIEIEAELPIEDKSWSIGLIVGPSGCGKSTLAKHFWAKEMAHKLSWSRDESVLDAFPEAMSIKDVTLLMSSVGFSSPPSWLRPFHVLSNGEQFRVALARLLAELPELAVIDEFTSVVDRTVAQIGSAALAKTVRRRKQKLVAVTCHDDVERWLQPDWIYRPAERRFAWRSVQRRPTIRVELRRCERDVWRVFAPHHYLSADLHRSAACYGLYLRDRPIAFAAVLHFPHPVASIKKIHRLVVLPDYQGLSIGPILCDALGEIYAASNQRLSITTSHPALWRALAQRQTWRLTRAPGLLSRLGQSRGRRPTGLSVGSSTRVTATLEYRSARPPKSAADADLGGH